MSEFLPRLSLSLYIWKGGLLEVTPVDVVEEAEVRSCVTEWDQILKHSRVRTCTTPRLHRENH